MTILKSLRNIDTLSKSELEHCIQRMDIELENYERCIKNYSHVQLKKYGIPYKNKDKSS